MKSIVETQLSVTIPDEKTEASLMQLSRY